MDTPSEFIAVPIDNIPLGIELPFPLFVLVGGKHIKFREVKDTLSAERIKTLGEKTDAVFIPKNSWLAFLDYMEKTCDIDAKDPEVAAKHVRTLLLAYNQHLEQQALMQRSTLGKLRKLSYRLAALVNEHPKVTAKLLQRYKDHSVYYCAHNVNVAVYSLAMAKKLGLPLEDMKLLAFSCLVHNVGNLLVPHEILYKEGALTEEELKKARSHSLQGSQLLEYLDCPTEAVLTAKQHHERMDGAGYPYGLWGAEIHLFAKICAIADVYDALTSSRPGGKTPLSPKDAIQEMTKMKGHFDPKILSTMGNA